MTMNDDEGSTPKRINTEEATTQEIRLKSDREE